ncbi:MAG: hypothetical protein JNJ83_24560 [Verrucomicrobiaceae bacterium]|nr:hypothetical protein [Verrucomicrobiaceae bacterium]
MNKVAVMIGLLGLACLGVSAGLWFSAPETESGAIARVVELQRQLKDAHATIADLEAMIESMEGRGTSPVIVSNMAGPSTTPQSSHLQPANWTAPTFGATQARPMPNGAAHVAVESAPPPATPADAREIKRLATAEALYADLISRFNLNPAERETFKALVAARADIKKGAMSKMADPGLSPVERQQIYKDAVAAMTANSGQLRDFLNDDQDFARFALWEETAIERELMDAGRAIFDNDGSGLTQDQEDWLVKAAYDLRNRKEGLADPYNLESLTDTAVDQPYVTKVLDKYDRDSTLLLQNARGRFNASQIESIRKWRHQGRVSLESRLWNMSRTVPAAAVK